MSRWEERGFLVGQRHLAVRRSFQSGEGSIEYSVQRERYSRLFLLSRTRPWLTSITYEQKNEFVL